MAMDVLARPDRARAAGLLVLQGWPRGFCPRHAMTDGQCMPWCMEVRRQFAKAAEDLRQYFASLYGRSW